MQLYLFPENVHYFFFVCLSVLELCFPGDGREHGINFSCLYRLLRCDFENEPDLDDLTEDEAEKLGIAYENYLPYIEMRNITKGLPVPVIAERIGTTQWLPPSLGTLIGYRGLDLHRDYLKTSATSPFVQSGNTAAIEELDEDDPMEGPSGQTESVPQASEVEEPDASENNEQKEADSDEDENSSPHRKSNDIIFGDEDSDGLLLSRMMTLFYWAGIVSTI